MKIEVLGGNRHVEFEHGGTWRTLVSFHRTLRLPEDGIARRLPPSLGNFPLRRIVDYRERVPAAWREHGGIFLPMWQREALWIDFTSSRPVAIKVAAGKINAVSGERWSETLAPPAANAGAPRQDYVVVPPQPWLDGFNSGEGRIRQFVSMPLGGGHTVEAQATGKEDVGGLQLLVVPAKASWKPPQPQFLGLRSGSPYGNFGGPKLGGGGFPDASIGGGVFSSNVGGQAGGSSEFVEASYSVNSDSMDPTRHRIGSNAPRRDSSARPSARAAEMGLAQGGEMEQKIYPDPYGLDTWDEAASGRLFVHLVNSELWREITGEEPPPSPVTADTYRAHGYAWTSLWDSEMGDVPAAASLSGMKTVSQVDAAKGIKEGGEW